MQSVQTDAVRRTPEGPPAAPGAAQVCPICKSEGDLKAVEKEITPQDVPYWHEAEVGAKSRGYRLVFTYDDR